MKIIEIIKEADVEGKFGPQKRTAFKVEGNPNMLSAFSKYSLKVGQEVDGTIEQSADGKWWNFKFSPKKPVPAGLAEAQLYQIKQASESAYAANIAIQSLAKRLEEAGVIKPLYTPYPERDAANTPDFGPEELGIDPESIPF